MFGRRKFKHKRKLKKPLIFLRGWFLAIVVFTAVCLVGAYFLFMGYTKEFREMAETYELDLIGKVERPNLILDRKFEEVGRIFVENRSEVPIELVPQKMIDALVSGEDSRFFTHDGVDYMGVMRAALGNLKSGNEDSGASTITMQLARNAFPLQKDTEAKEGDKYDRKFLEIFLSYRIEEKFSKDQIMEFYLNRVPFGSGYYGVRSASLGYFGKEPKDLEVWECASLVGCIKNPSVFSPLNNPENNKKSRNNVLNRMSVEGFLTQEECDSYRLQAVVTNPKPLERGTSYFYDRVTAFVQQAVPDEAREEGGLKIFTTLDKELQRSLETSIQGQLYLVESREDYNHPKYEDYQPKEKSETNYLQGAGLLYNHKTGAVLAYVGGRDFKHSQYDFIQAGKRPLGTAFLPVVYASALENGYNLSSPVIDEAMDNRMVMVSSTEGILAEWGGETLEPQYEGFIPARQALADSKIAATVRLSKEIGLEKVNEVAERWGFSMPRTNRDKRILVRGVIGSESASVLNVAQTYSAIGNDGMKPDELFWVNRIEDASGKVLYKNPRAPKQKQVMKPEQAFLMHTALQDVWKRGNLKEEFTAKEDFDFKGGVKTGTTYNFSDHWCVGYNGDLSCAVWAGFFSSNKPIYSGAFAKDTILPVWKDLMMSAAKGDEASDVVKPEHLLGVRVCSHSGLKCTHDCYEQRKDAISGKTNYESTGVMEFFEKGKEPTTFCDVHGDFASAEVNVILNSVASAKELLYVLPIEPTSLALVGDDPYGADIPAFEPYEDRNTDSAILGSGIILDKMDTLDLNSSIYQPRPGRVFVDE